MTENEKIPEPRLEPNDLYAHPLVRRNREIIVFLASLPVVEQEKWLRRQGFSAPTMKRYLQAVKNEQEWRSTHGEGNGTKTED